LTGERRGTGILPRHGGRFSPVNVDQVAGELVVVGTIIHRRHLIESPAARAQ
jgi:hypothetical protein